ncbi:MAG: hypothetical protein JWQ90_2141 [Hydrocarboniphaga sp.]|uniref:hypothetical protein n=1 Tax=Hydrocarboniphaga sp. TaxID=2033016 RepID=UPI002614025B|nr:hypothetical protein [Hydrocarboniphaga sp.]MDB5969691.1 hypothetical protein [Hydrocarboniphaga sp.]
MTADEAMSFVREHGIVLTAARGPVPCLAEAIAREPIKGSWWAHPKGRQIFAVLQKLSESPEILVCRLVNGKVTLVHRRLWPALIRLADQFEPGQLAQVHQEHTSAGHHVAHDVPYPQWVPEAAFEEAQRLSKADALKALGPIGRRKTRHV